jgi:hypothetical protein
MTAEHVRMEKARERAASWKKWGPYLSERQWGTVREDYSEGGDAWNYFSHDQARSRAYHWGEDGLAGICDELCTAIPDPRKTGLAGCRLGSILDETKLRRVLAKMLDEKEFLSPYGIRSLSRYHADHPYVIKAGGQEYRVCYLPAESDTGMFGGNSNWRGPVWMPVNALILRALVHYFTYYGPSFTVECPTGSGRQMNLQQVAVEIARRLANIFLRGQDGRRPVFGGSEKFQKDPHWRDYLQFYEYCHGDNGAGLGASHQTGWTGIIARLMHGSATVHAEQLLKAGTKAFFEAEAPSGINASSVG